MLNFPGVERMKGRRHNQFVSLPNSQSVRKSCLVPTPGPVLPELLCVKHAGGCCPPSFFLQWLSETQNRGRAATKGLCLIRKQRKKQQHCTHHDAGTCYKPTRESDAILSFAFLHSFCLRPSLSLPRL